MPAGPSCAPIEVDGTRLPLAPERDRIHTTTPTFSNLTAVTNPLFPIADLHSAVQMGTVDNTLASQYHAYLDGRILEVAIDWYAQADDGPVWYFGEDAFNCEDVVVADTHGSWLASRDGPPGMIMPADPAVGDVYRSENIAGNVFEEVTVREVGVPVAGPLGLVDRAIVIRELHQIGAREN